MYCASTSDYCHCKFKFCENKFKIHCCFGHLMVADGATQQIESVLLEMQRGTYKYEDIFINLSFPAHWSSSR